MASNAIKRLHGVVADRRRLGHLRCLIEMNDLESLLGIAEAARRYVDGRVTPGAAVRELEIALSKLEPTHGG